MSRRSRNPGVKGPNSALTEFLRTEGITDAFRDRLRRQGRSLALPTALADTQSPEVRDTASDPDGVVTVEVLSDEEILAAARRKRGGPDFSDDDSDGDYDPGKKFGEQDSCVECGTEFYLSVYSRYVEAKKGYLCEGCNEEFKKRERQARRNEQSARRKRKKMAQALLDRQKVTIASLQDVCIRKITANIGDVEALGDIGQANVNKILRILSKNRSLTSLTMPLFLQPNLRTLEFWDCLNVDSDTLNQIAAFCPNLERLTLFMCGNLHNDNLQYYKTNLRNLTHLSLNGPFLISDAMWQDYFETGCPNLTSFEVRNTHRFGNDLLISLLDNCGRRLTSLRLSRLDGLDSQAVYDLLPHYLQPHLTDLELSYPHTESLVTNDLVVNIFAIAGSLLQTLNLDGCSGLTDVFLYDGVAKYGAALTSLSLRGLDMLTDEGFAGAFLLYPSVNAGGLIYADLTKCTGLGDQAVYALFLHSAHTLVELSVNSLYNITKDFLLEIFTPDHHPSKNKEDTFGQVAMPLLTRWDVGFVKAVDDEVLAYISSNCPKLKILEVFGDSKCTGRAKVRHDLLVIGRQHDIA